ncbi:MAG TPA: HTTM domain-containing protein [Kofleriaceae bacterium]|nr:HTTM domain-containing protein [Kofleriaceae bacterium]
MKASSLLARIEQHPLWRRYLRFWTEVRVAPEVLALFRLLFFGVLAVDMWLQVEHAPRYGAGDFNVSHLPALDSWLPVLTRPLVAFLFILQAYLAGLFALGGGGRPVLVGLTVLFGVTYFSSQLDSYQHHYLMFLVLLVLCFVRWEPAPAPPPGKKAPDPPPDWPVRLILVQISILYFYAAIAKTDPLWLDGRVLERQVSAEWARDLIDRMGGFKTVSGLVIATELGLAAAIHLRALRRFVAPVGILFHAGIEASGFQIGLFSYFMIALYVLVLPEAPIVRLVQWVHRHVPAIPLVTKWAGAARLVLRGSALALGAALLLLVPIGAAVAAAVAALVIGVAAQVALGRELRDRHALAHLGACLLVAALSRPAVTDVARDYHRFWGGSARRLGDLETATAAYQRAVELAPDHASSRVSLARLYQRTGRGDLALREAQRAQSLEPADYRGHLVEAMIRDAAGEGEAAVAAAERALALEPGDRDASAISARWRKRLGMPPREPSAPATRREPAGDDDGDEE